MSELVGAKALAVERVRERLQQVIMSHESIKGNQKYINLNLNHEHKTNVV